jgi:hypothetical protein
MNKLVTNMNGKVKSVTVCDIFNNPLMQFGTVGAGAALY